MESRLSVSQGLLPKVTMLSLRTRILNWLLDRPFIHFLCCVWYAKKMYRTLELTGRFLGVEKKIDSNLHIKLDNCFITDSIQREKTVRMIYEAIPFMRGRWNLKT